jgi:hypothetical protein
MVIVNRIFKLLFLGIIACTLSNYAFGQLPEWKESSMAESGFALSFPAEPTVEKVTIGGKLQTTLTAATDKQLFFILVSDVGQKVSTNEDLDAIYDGFREGSKSKMPLLTERSISLNGLPGREMIFANDKVYLVSRVFFYQGKLFAMCSASEIGGGLEPNQVANRTKFFNSFRLTAS